MQLSAPVCLSRVTSDLAHETLQMQYFHPEGLAWHPDLPDFRDYRLNNQLVLRLLRSLPRARNLHTRLSLEKFFPYEVPQQGEVVSGVAHACVGVIQYFEYRAFARPIIPSARFLTSLAAQLDLSGTEGGSLRAALKALRKVGVPPELLVKRSLARGLACDTAPALFAWQDEYRALVYLRLDSRRSSPRALLERLKSFLNAGFPVLFGFVVPSSLTRESSIDYRPVYDSVLGGQVAILIGYDDSITAASRGAFKIRCAWGSRWGERGYGWLPYLFVLEGMALDFWVLLRPDWLATGEFAKPCCLSDV